MALAILPAAGKSSRFGGLFKEMLPTPIGETLLEYHIRSFELNPHISHILIVTSPEKINAHATVATKYPCVSLTLQKEDWDIYGAIYAALPFAQDINYFVMPDTWLPIDAHLEYPSDAFTLGMFLTQKPDRFGVWHQGHIENKRDDFSKQVLYEAWGSMIFTQDVASYWMRRQNISYTSAINQAIDEFGVNKFALEYYYDMATVEDYKEFLNESLSDW